MRKLKPVEFRVSLDVGEMVGGVLLGQVNRSVDLDMAYSPIILYPAKEEQVPICYNATKLPNGEYLVYDENRVYVIDTGTMKVLRARWLLYRDYYYKLLSNHRLDGDEAHYNKVISQFFPDGILTLKRS